MSVIVFNTDDNKMYADTALTQGATVQSRIRKVRQYKLGSRYSIMAGGIGYPDIVAVQQLYVMELLGCLARCYGGRLVDVLTGAEPIDIPRELLREYDTDLSIVCKHNGQPTADSTVLIAVKDDITGKKAIGLLGAGLSVMWGISHWASDDDIVVADSRLIMAYRSTDKRLSTPTRLAQASRTFSHVGVFGNEIRSYDFDGNSTHENYL